MILETPETKATARKERLNPYLPFFLEIARLEKTGPLSLGNNHHDIYKRDYFASNLNYFFPVFEWYLKGLNTWAKNPSIESFYENKGIALEILMKEFLKRNFTGFDVYLSPAELDFNQEYPPVDIIVSKSEGPINIPYFFFSIKTRENQEEEEDKDIQISPLLQTPFLHLFADTALGNFQSEKVLREFGTTQEPMQFIDRIYKENQQYLNQILLQKIYSIQQDTPILKHKVSVVSHALRENLKDTK